MHVVPRIELRSSCRDVLAAIEGRDLQRSRAKSHDGANLLGCVTCTMSVCGWLRVACAIARTLSTSCTRCWCRRSSVASRSFRRRSGGLGFGERCAGERCSTRGSLAADAGALGPPLQLSRRASPSLRENRKIARSCGEATLRAALWGFTETMWRRLNVNRSGKASGRKGKCC